MGYDNCVKCGKKVTVGDFFIMDKAYCKEDREKEIKNLGDK